MKQIILVLGLISVVAAQVPSPPAPPANQYSYDDSFSASAGETLTLQLPANSNRGWYGYWLAISLNSSAQAKVCFLNNGTAATATAATPTQLFGAQIPVTRIFTSSNSTGGGSIGCVTIAGAQPWDIRNMFMSRANSITPAPSGTVQNISIVVTPVSGTITGDIFVLWSEQ